MSHKDISNEQNIEYISNDHIDIFENELEIYINDYCSKMSIDNLSCISQNQWNGLLRYLCRKYIKPSGILKLNDAYGSYDINKVNELLNFYIDFCYQYDKEISLVGFTHLSDISDSVLYEWENNERGKYSAEASASRSEITKRLKKERENSLSNKLLSGKNPVGVLGILNHFYSWNMPGVREEKKSTGISLADLQKQAALLSDNSRGVMLETTEKMPDKLSDNYKQLENP